MRSEPNESNNRTTTESNDEAAYELRWEVDHFKNFGLDWTEDLLIEPFDGYDSSLIYRNDSFAHPDPIVYQGYLKTIGHIDYPYTDNSWPVMTKRMLEVLLTVESFEHRALPVAIVDWQTPRDGWRDQSGKLREEIVNHEYVALQLTEFSDVFDRLRSVYTVDEDEPDRLVTIDKYVFKSGQSGASKNANNRDQSGLPPIFKITERPTRLFVSREARTLLKEAGISGPRYISLKGFREGTGDFVDVPVQLPDSIYQTA